MSYKKLVKTEFDVFEKHKLCGIDFDCHKRCIQTITLSVVKVKVKDKLPVLS